MARAVALALGAFAILNLVRGWVSPGLDDNLWWIDLRILPRWTHDGLLGCAAVVLLLIGFDAAPTKGIRHVGILACVVLLAIVSANVATFYSLQLRGKIHAGPLPLSALVAAALLLLIISLARPRPSPRRRAAAAMVMPLMLIAVLFPLAQMTCFGKTDYRRHADAIVVFGARAYADGRTSDALSDRVLTACDLYRRGFAPRLVFSGGPGDGDIHETQAMRDLAMSQGVPDDAILLDPQGVNTRATVDNTTTLFADIGVRRVLAVSHAFHLPRVKMSYQRAGLNVFTVPAHEHYFLSQMPYLMLREVGAFWMYYFRL